MKFFHGEKLGIIVSDLRGDNTDVESGNKGWYVNRHLFDSVYSMYMDMLLSNGGKYPDGAHKLFSSKCISIHNSLEWAECHELYDMCSYYRTNGTKIVISSDCYLIPSVTYRGRFVSLSE